MNAYLELAIEFAIDVTMLHMEADIGADVDPSWPAYAKSELAGGPVDVIERYWMFANKIKK